MPKPTILVIDDTIDNLNILIDILKPYYKVKAAPNGPVALKIANSNTKPDLILLDIMMPEMDGYDVCKRLKANKATAKIPVIFVTTMGKVADEFKGFELGGVDYITKPLSPPIILARVKTHLDLKKAKDQVDRLYSQTVMGTIKIMSDLTAIIHPKLSNQALRLKQYARQIGNRLKLPGMLRLETAAILSQIGTITIPVEILEKFCNGVKLTSGEQKFLNTHPMISKDLLSNIPGLEVVSKIIEKQIEAPPKSNYKTWNFVTVCGQILKLAVAYDNLLMSGRAKKDAFSVLYLHKDLYPQTLLDVLMKTENEKPAGETKMLYLTELRKGMILLEDVVCDYNVTLAGKNIEISDNILMLLHRNAEIRILREPIKVLVTAKPTEPHKGG